MTGAAKPDSGGSQRPAAATKHPGNRLAESTSPYLLQHAENPVYWEPWGEEAIARATERQYSPACRAKRETWQWCRYPWTARQPAV